MSTTVVITNNNQVNDWDHSICGCFDDLGACLLTWFFPCITFGLNASESGTCCEGCCGTFWGCVLFFIPCVNCCVWCSIRSNIRNKHHIAPNCCADCCTILFCGCCAMIQERQQCNKPLQSTVTIIQQPGVAVPPQQAYQPQNPGAAGYPPNANQPQYPGGEGYPPNIAPYNPALNNPAPPPYDAQSK